jgi:hypothetical protein
MTTVSLFWVFTRETTRPMVPSPSVKISLAVTFPPFSSKRLMNESHTFCV